MKKERKGTMKRKLFMLVLFSFLLMAGCGGKETKAITPAAFAQPGEETDNNFKEVICSVFWDEIGFGETLPVYKILPREANQQALLDEFGFTTGYEETKAETSTLFSQGSQKLTLYSFGSFSFQKERNLSDPEELTMSDELIFAEADDYLKKNFPLPQDFKREPDIKKTTVTNLSTDEKVVVGKAVQYERVINGCRMIGNTRIRVQYDKDGISSVVSLYNNYEQDVSLPALRPKEAFDKIFSPEALFVADPMPDGFGRERSLCIDKVELVYYDDPTNPDLTHIQPCYRFSGVIQDENGNRVNCYAVVLALEEVCYS